MIKTPWEDVQRLKAKGYTSQEVAVSLKMPLSEINKLYMKNPPLNIPDELKSTAWSSEKKAKMRPLLQVAHAKDEQRRALQNLV